MRQPAGRRTKRGRPPLSYLVNGGLSLGIGATFAGFLAPWWPAVELINHFRPFVVLGAGLLLVLSLVVRRPRLVATAAALFVVNAVLLILPFALFGARTNEAANDTLRVASLNTWVPRGQADRIGDFIARADADIVLLQEVGRRDRAALLDDLARIYPHILYDPETRFGPALLSKRPWSETGVVRSGRKRPLAVWARFDRDGRSFLVGSVHAANPFEWEEQASDVERLIAFARSQPPGMPMILGGDFNLTPFSWSLIKFARAAEMEWAQTFAASWPATRSVQLVLLDHILFTDAFDLARVETGPPVGSDHLPITADLSLRESD